MKDVALLNFENLRNNCGVKYVIGPFPCGSGKIALTENNYGLTYNNEYSLTIVGL